MDENLKSTQNSPFVQSLVPVDVKTQEFQKLMLIYEKAMVKARGELENIGLNLKESYGYDVINNIDCRVKTPDSIIKKMKKKNYELNYKNLIENVNDVAGIRLVCPFKTDIPKIEKVIEKNTAIEVLQIKDYIKKPKKSGYSGLHLIGQVPVDISDLNANVKVEIQIRTMAMDFWATAEHKLKYKADNRLSAGDSKKMIKYAKILNQMDEKISKINSKYIKNNLETQ